MKKSVRSNDIRYFINYKGKATRVALVEDAKMDQSGYFLCIRIKDGRESWYHHSNLYKTKPTKK